MIQLTDADSGAALGLITDEQLQFLVDQLEEEALTDQDYYISRDILELLDDAGADPALVALLRQGMGDREDMEIRWSRR